MSLPSYIFWDTYGLFLMVTHWLADIPGGKRRHRNIKSEKETYKTVQNLYLHKKIYETSTTMSQLTWSSPSGENTVTLEEQDNKSTEQTAGTMLIQEQDNLIWTDFWQTATSGWLWLTPVISEPQMCHCMFPSNALKTLCEVLQYMHGNLTLHATYEHLSVSSGVGKLWVFA